MSRCQVNRHVIPPSRGPALLTSSKTPPFSSTSICRYRSTPPRSRNPTTVHSHRAVSPFSLLRSERLPPAEIQPTSSLPLVRSATSSMKPLRGTADREGELRPCVIVHGVWDDGVVDRLCQVDTPEFMAYLMFCES